MNVNLNLKLLIVDDDPDILDILTYDFQVLECNVETATNSIDALNQLKTKKFDAVISDLRLSEGGGEELLFACSQMPIEEKPVFILMTGSLTESDEAIAFHLGAEGFIRKPFTRNLLQDSLRRISLPLHERWKKGTAKAPDDALNLEMELEDIKQSMQNKTFKLGRGGLFVALEDNHPAVGEILKFDIKIGPSPTRLIGAGVVRWIRSTSEKDMPSGIGIEILELEPQSLVDFDALQSQYPTRAYIPRM